MACFLDFQNKFEPLRPNVPCQNCKRNSNLKCIWCDTIYCSVKCQCEVSEISNNFKEILIINKILRTGMSIKKYA